ncbi:MAG: sigma-70 family RNA polymerase sigma factor [Planctomycetota bacterium]
MEPSPTPSRRSLAAPALLDAELVDLIDRFRGPLVGLLRSRGAADPPALAQDVFAEAWMGRARFRGDWSDDAAVGPWLAGIARNLARSESRRSAREPMPLDMHADLVAPEPASRDDGAAIRVAIDALEPELREIVLMHYIEQTPQARVAALLGISERAVEGRLYRARQKLARTLSGSAQAKEQKS